MSPPILCILDIPFIYYKIDWMKNVLFIALLAFYNVAQGQNLLTNGSFENDLTSWWTGVSGGGEATFSIETGDAHTGGKALRAQITTPGAQAWDVQVINNTAWPSVAGREYKLTFYGKVIGAPASLRLIQQIDAAYTSLDQAITQEWQQYTWTFTAGANNLEFKIHFPNAGTFLLDNFIITGDISTEPITATVDVSLSHQTMVGFGGALTWHCDRITRSNHKNEIAQLLFEDLGSDIIRLKNWYYPQNYPQNKTTDVFHVDWFKPHFEATKELYELAKTYNPTIEILLSSWGPPASLKSNDKLEEGTLKKNPSGNFMYEELAQYMEDVLNNVGFNPDYLSIQNEPGYENAGWTTCGWRPEEEDNYPAYAKGLDIIHDKIKTRQYVPKLIGPETENIGNALWNSAQNTFGSMAETVKDKEYLYGYAYHLYNYGSPSSINTSYLHLIKKQYGNKPAFMTEFSGNSYDWLQTAHMIQLNLMEANAVSYIYWDMMWNEDSDAAMITIDNNGDYTIHPYYYTIKHFAGHINKNYSRIEVSGSSNQVKITGFKNTDGTGYTFVLTNNGAANQSVNLELPKNLDIITLEGFQSTEGNFYSELQTIDPHELVLPSKSITTLSFTVDELITTAKSSLSHTAGKRTFELFPVPASDKVTIKCLDHHTPVQWEILSVQGMSIKTGQGSEVSVSDLAEGLYLIRVNEEILRFVKE